MNVEAENPYKKVWLGLGGNIGDVPHNMAKALRKLIETPDNKLLDISSLYKTPPWGNVDQPWFYNSCALIHTRLDPQSFLDQCLKVELSLKRERLERWGPRTIDLDILSFEGVEYFKSDSLTLPHPRISERCFVLLPLVEIAPDLKIGVHKVCDLIKKCVNEDIEKVSNGKEWINF